MGDMSIMDIGRTALAAQKAAIEVTGQNIANVNTPGYSRQSAILKSAPVDPGTGVGGGVLIDSIQRTYDRFLQMQINTAIASNGKQGTEQSALQRIEPLFSDLVGNGPGTALQDFFNSWQDLAMNPQGAAERQSVLAKAQTLVDNFHQVSSALNSVMQDANQSLVPITSNINTITKQIADLNGMIRSALQSGSNTNQLYDSREQLVQGLSRIVGVTCIEQADGTVNVSLTGGPQLVTDARAATLSLQSDPANSGFSNIIITPAAGGASSDITALITGAGANSGQLGGTLQVRDTLIRGYLANLDELASSLATQVNSVHAAGFGMSGSTGVNFFTAPAAPVPPATYTAGYSGAIALNISSVNSIAAAAVDPTLPGGGTGNNSNALAIADLANKTLSMSGGSYTLAGFYGSLVGKVGLATQTANMNTTQGTTLLKQLNSFRDSASGVSLDEELLALTKYQKAFQGAARLITTGQEMMDTVLNMIR